ncbi:MAG: glycosyltransferase family protein, partial [Planctomycetota bacterium]
RLSSRRLPKKVLLDVGGKTMIEQVVDRIQRCKLVDEIMIATSDQDSDQKLVAFCHSRGWTCFRGSENDVLSRYVEAAHQSDAEIIVRITSDCPLIEPKIVDQVIKLIQRNPKVDYASNFYPLRHFPRGLDCEAFTRKTLMRLDNLAKTAEYREHVTLFAYRNADQFKIGSITADSDLSSYRWTVDTIEDLQLVRGIYQHFGQDRFTFEQIIDAYPRFPEWLALNQHITQKATNAPIESGVSNSGASQESSR